MHRLSLLNVELVNILITKCFIPVPKSEYYKVKKQRNQNSSLTSLDKFNEMFVSFCSYLFDG